MRCRRAVAPSEPLAARARPRDARRAARRRATRARASSTAVDLDRALERARDAVNANENLAYGLWGHGKHLGLPAKWYLRVDDDGFVEETMNAELCYVSGRAKGRAGGCWEVDFSGYAQALELDDAEASTMSAWTRSGYWATQECVNEHLELTLRDRTEEDARDGVVRMGMKLRGGRVTSELTLDATAWTPKKLAVAVCGDEDLWTFDDWTTSACGVTYARTTKLYGANGGVQEFIADGVARGRGKEGRKIFEKPTIATPTVTVDPDSSSEVQVIRASSSHVLVEPLIDGKSAGPFILDTGASGLVITPKAAKTLGLRAFGEVHVSGVSGRVPCQFRRGNKLKLGPLTLQKPLFMEMGLDGIVSGASKPIAGIIGFDAFKSAILSVSEGGERVNIYDSRQLSAIDEDWAWQELRLVSNVPHVAATFSGVNDAHKTEPNIFMIDSGAGGADVIFHSKAVDELGLSDLLDSEGRRVSSRVRGVSGANGESGGATLTYRTTMEWLQLVSADAKGECVRFENIDTLLASGEGFSLSEHSCGMICARLLGKKTIVYDVPRRRIAFIE
jgi:hypothetical protein|tara:strand:- start:3884 stop:5569 length:1686 start_codon:yes stop_codon:yes gene_type:complete